MHRGASLPRRRLSEKSGGMLKRIVAALAGKPLRYLIGAEDAPPTAGCVVEAPYRVPPPPGGIWYLNCFDQRDSYKQGRGEYGPYREPTKTSGDYNEGIVDPAGPRWLAHIDEQLARVPPGGVVEWDNITDLIDLTSLQIVLDLYDRTAQRGISIIAKNPGDLGRADAIRLLEHPAVVGTIVERGAGCAVQMHAMRVAAGKPDLPVRFVAFGDGKAWAQSMAASIRAHGYADMGVTYDSAAEEYGGAIEDIQLPAPLPPEALPASAAAEPSPPSPPQPPLTLAARIVAAAEKRGARIDRGPGELNIVYVEGVEPDGTPNANRSNAFDDVRYVIGFRDGAPQIIGAWEATTQTGRLYTENPVEDARALGAAIIALGQQRCWQFGLHRGYEALVQSGGAISVDRDKNKNYVRDDLVTTGWYGINQHHAFDAPRDDIGSHSAGCMVGRTVAGHHEFMALVKSDPRYRADPKFVFATTVITADDLPAVGTSLKPTPTVPVASGTIIDTAVNVTGSLAALRAAGVGTVIRYLTTNTSGQKCIKTAEARAIAAAAMRLGLVYETWGGVDGFAHGDIDAASGAAHGEFARRWAAEQLGAPQGACVYFAIDTDASGAQITSLVLPLLCCG
jgi:hypothetical protein